MRLSDNVALTLVLVAAVMSSELIRQSEANIYYRGGSSFTTLGPLKVLSGSFKQCCSLGKQASDASRGCTPADYSSLVASSSSSDMRSSSGACMFAFTVCCSQTKRNNECEHGKRHAHAGLACSDLKKNHVASSSTSPSCDALTDCCQCCELGIKAKINGDECSHMPELSGECNSIFMGCCKNTQPSNDCSNSHICPNGQVCENSKSGPVCQCPIGFEMDERTKTCVDVDECRRPRICGDTGSKCQNTIGSYMCTKSCGVGYMFNAIIYTCQDLNECARGTHNCATGMRCENYPGTFRCIREKPCGTGYHVNAYTQECEDIDECALNIHDCSRNFICQNTPGSYKCKAKECSRGYVFNYNTGECEAIVCQQGYELNDQNSCCDINECEKYPESPCSFNERCENTPGSYKCTLVLVCDQGFELNVNKTECVDINECTTDRHTCPTMATCVNTPGGYKCQCPSGFKLDENRNMCEDLNECTHGQICPSNSYCRNTVGSYKCECKKGFKLVSHIFYSCEDENECEQSGICDHKCINTYGSYQCACREGYKLADDKKTCVDINECELQANLCPGVCRNTPGSYECSCPVGFVLDIKQRRICEDIDECELKTHSCGARDVCVNTRGRFKCMQVQCPDGYSLIADAKVSRCDRANAVCKHGEYDCLRKPSKIFYSYTSFSYQVPVPIRIFTTRVNTYSRRIRLKHEFKLVDAESSMSLRENQFLVKQTDANTLDVYLLEPFKCSGNLNMELKVEFYNEHQQLSTCLLNKIYVIITD